MAVYFPLVDQTTLGRVYEFDRVFNGLECVRSGFH
jgi:hypothetical protein